MLKIKTAPAKQSFTIFIEGCNSGWSLSIKFSMAVLISSVDKTPPMDRQISPHQTASALKKAKRTKALRPIKICHLKLDSYLNVVKIPAKAN